MRLDFLVLVVVVAAAALGGLLWLTGVVFFLPFGFLLIIPAVAVLALLGIIIHQRLNNREDDYYDKNVDQ